MATIVPVVFFVFFLFLYPNDSSSSVLWKQYKLNLRGLLGLVKEPVDVREL